MKKCLLITCCLMVSVPSIVSADTNVSIDFDTGYAVGYGFQFLDSPVQKINLNQSLGKGFYGNLWTAIDGGKKVAEIDYTLGFYRALTDKTSIDISYNLYDLTKLGKSEIDAFMLKAIVSHQLTDSISISAGIEDYKARMNNYLSGQQVYADFNYLLQFTNAISVASQFRFGKDTSYGADEKFVRISVSPSWQVNDDFAVRFLGFTNWLPENEDGQFIWTILGLDYSF